MNDALHGGERVVADRVGVLVRRGDQLVPVRHELPGDGVVGRLDERLECGRYGDGVAMTDGIQGCLVRCRGKPGGDEAGGVADGSLLGHDAGR